MGINAGGGSSTVNPAEALYQTAATYPLTLKSFLKQVPNIVASEQEYQPVLADLANQIANKTRTATTQNVGALAPKVMSVLRAYNPEMTGLMDTLTGQAREQLKLNGALDPATLRTLQQSLRTGQAARGLATSPGSAAMESYYTTQTQEQRRAANQGFAQSVTAQSANTFKDPFSILLGMNTNVPVTPQITSSSTADSMYGMLYNANSAAGISNANANAAQNAMAAQMIGSGASSIMGGGSSVSGSAMKAGMCCFIFMEAYRGRMPGCIRRMRDKYYARHPRIANGYKRMARWLVPAMQRSRLVRWAVWHAMIKPATAYASELRHGRDKWVSHFWLRTWAMIGG